MSVSDELLAKEWVVTKQCSNIFRIRTDRSERITCLILVYAPPSEDEKILSKKVICQNLSDVQSIFKLEHSILKDIKYLYNYL